MIDLLHSQWVNINIYIYKEYYITSWNWDKFELKDPS